jgi:hypothetical protein
MIAGERELTNLNYLRLESGIFALLAVQTGLVGTAHGAYTIHVIGVRSYFRKVQPLEPPLSSHTHIIIKLYSNILSLPSTSQYSDWHHG